MEKIKKNINIYLKIIIILFFALVFFSINKCYMCKDDEVFGSAFYNFTTFKIWVNEYYHIWSGRIITSALSTIFLKMPLVVYKIFNTLVFIISIISILEITKSFQKTNSKKQNIMLSIIFAMFFILDFRVIKDGALWVMGSFIYIWPTAFMFVALIPFIKHINQENINPKWFILFFVADLIACFSEQTALVLLCFGGLTLLYSFITKQKVNKFLIIHYVLIMILTIIEISAPGNYVRTQASTLRRYPTFNMLSVGDKILEGTIVLANQMLSFDRIVMLVLTLLIMCNIMKYKKESTILKILSTIPFIYFFLSIVFNNYEVFNGILYNIPLFGKKYIYGITIYIPIILFVLNISIIAILLLFSSNNIKKDATVSVIYLASIASSISVSFSPTIYVSIPRIFFVTDFLLLAVISIMAERLIEKKKENN